jgi:hypothetical protein
VGRVAPEEKAGTDMKIDKADVRLGFWVAIGFFLAALLLSAAGALISRAGHALGGPGHDRG